VLNTRFLFAILVILSLAVNAQLVRATNDARLTRATDDAYGPLPDELYAQDSPSTDVSEVTTSTPIVTKTITATLAIVAADAVAASTTTATTTTDAPVKEREERRASGLRHWIEDEYWVVWPTHFSFAETDIGLGAQVSWVRQHGYVDTRISFSGIRTRMDDSTEKYKLRLGILNIETRFYTRNRTFWSLIGGLYMFHPGANMQMYFDARGEVVGNNYQPFGGAAFGWQMGRMRLGKRYYPLVLRLGYTFAQPFEFPSPLPMGTEEIDPGGFSSSVRLRFRY